MKAADLDPVQIGKKLRHLRNQGVPFDAAWTIAAGVTPGKGKGRTGTYDDHVSMRAFMEKHFRAAYNNLPTQNGRFGTESIEGREVRERVPLIGVPHEQRCKSGDGCDRKRGHGRTGLFCKMHADELAAIDLSSEFNKSLPEAA